MRCPRCEGISLDDLESGVIVLELCDKCRGELLGSDGIEFPGDYLRAIDQDLEWMRAYRHARHQE